MTLCTLFRRLFGCQKAHHGLTTNVRFPGFTAILPNGDILMANQQLLINNAYTDTVAFTDAAGNPSPALSSPTVALDPPANGTVGLSADGVHVNVTLTAIGDVMVNYSGTNAVGATVSTSRPLSGVDVTTGASLGDFAPGTTT